MRCVSVSSSVPSSRPKGARLALFGLGLGIFSLLPNETGYQDIAALLARQPGVTERWQTRMFASPASAIQVATYSFGRPIGTAGPQTANTRLASLGNALGASGADITGALTRGPLAPTPRPYQASDFPKVDRTMKGDRLVTAPAAAPSGPADSFPTNQSVMGAKAATAEPASGALDPELAEALNAPPLHAPDVALSLDSDPLNEAKAPVEGVAAGTAPAPARDGFAVQTAHLFFDASSLGASLGTMERWQPGEEPTLVAPDPEMKTPVAPLPLVTPESAGESIASKGEVNADNQKIKTPAERLGLFDPKARGKQEKCLAEAVYFEARGEAVRGQIAVAQVVMNRVFSGFYPTTPCGVVYQNAHRHLACQFTFACDGIRDVVSEPDMWERAKKIAKATLDGRLWLPEVAKSTHYHASWVHPYWVREMKKQIRFGVHTFYRPRKWGDGSDAPSWGTQAQTAEISARLAAVKP